MERNIGLANDVSACDVVTFPFKYSICTLLNDVKEYESMIDSFISNGFNVNECEYLFINNSNENKYDAYSGIRHFLTCSKGQYIILCHQDIILKDSKSKLDGIIEHMDKIDKSWALLGNAGGVRIKKFAKYFTNSKGKVEKVGNLPAGVQSLDENFLIINSKTNISVSNDLTGFHFYGTDLCLIAKIIGYSSYVIDFMIMHKSPGKMNQSFYEVQQKFIDKYSRALSPRYIQTVCVRFYISSSYLLNFLLNKRFSLFLAKEYFKLKNKFELND
jgi:hypothetical protein